MGNVGNLYSFLARREFTISYVYNVAAESVRNANREPGKRPQRSPRSPDVCNRNKRQRLLLGERLRANVPLTFPRRSPTERPRRDRPGQVAGCRRHGSLHDPGLPSSRHRTFHSYRRATHEHGSCRSSVPNRCGRRRMATRRVACSCLLPSRRGRRRTRSSSPATSRSTTRCTGGSIPSITPGCGRAWSLAKKAATAGHLACGRV